MKVSTANRIGIVILIVSIILALGIVGIKAWVMLHFIIKYW